MRMLKVWIVLLCVLHYSYSQGPSSTITCPLCLPGANSQCQVCVNVNHQCNTDTDCGIGHLCCSNPSCGRYCLRLPGQGHCLTCCGPPPCCNTCGLEGPVPS
ncbi:Hypothetical predicted protein [Mytilus galloprovincialis]|uniref:Uncharacterized protein n=2 Tax=Mytilus galloprovincialis TaxID=29158 RepID=A0A8B6EWL2_MYTGA|nr:Hypothetical predicted protein [Mytilus galloprovincialis]